VLEFAKRLGLDLPDAFARDFELFADLDEGFNCLCDLLGCVGCRKLTPDASFVFWHDGVAEADHVDVVLHQLVGHLCGLPSIANENRTNGDAVVS